MNSDLLDALVIGGGTAFWSALFASFQRHRPKILEELPHRERLGLPLNGCETILLIRETASLEAELRRDPRRSPAYKAGPVRCACVICYAFSLNPPEWFKDWRALAQAHDRRLAGNGGRG
jgi:hypothetical protein